METPNHSQPSSSPQLKGLASSLLQAIQTLRTPLLLTLALTACDGTSGTKKTRPTAPLKTSAPVFVPTQRPDMYSWDKRPERRRHEPYYPRQSSAGMRAGPFDSINFEYKRLMNHYFNNLRIAFSDGNETDVKVLLLKFKADKKMNGLQTLKANFNVSEERGKRRISAIQMLFKICEGKADFEDPDVLAFIEFLKAYRKVEKSNDMKSYWEALREYVKVSKQTNYGLLEIGKSPWNLLNKRRILLKKEEEAKAIKTNR